MALCASGEMSLAGSVVGRSVACELGCSGTGTISMDRADVRTLAGRPGAGCAICMCDFYGKSSAPPDPGVAVGSAFCGGYYAGVLSGQSYYMIIAPNATGCACCRWKTTRSGGDCCSTVDGYDNTYSKLTSALYPAGNWTATRSINGYSDWYLPARDELEVVYSHCLSYPAGEDWAGFGYWTSTQDDSPTTFACTVYFHTGIVDSDSKCLTNRLRAMRREPF